MWWISQPEMNYLLLREFDWHTTDFSTSCERIDFSINGTPRKHWPDVSVQTTAGTHFVQVKGDALAELDDFWQQWPATQRAICALGTPIRLVLEKEINSDPLLSVAQLLWPYSRFGSTLEERRAMLEHIGSAAHRLRDLFSTSEPRVAKRIVGHLLVTRALACIEFGSSPDACVVALPGVPDE